MSDTATLEAPAADSPTPATHAGPGPAPVPRKGLLVVGTELACAAGAMVIVTLLAAYTHFRDGTPGSEWPPPAVDIPNVAAVVLSVTLGMSAVTALWIFTAARDEDRRGVLLACTLTFVLGAAHINGMAFTIGALDIVAADGVYESVVYALLGTHTAMVGIGLAALVATFARAMGGQVNRARSETALAMVIGWWFICVAWAAVYTFVFLVK